MAKYVKILKLNKMSAVQKERLYNKLLTDNKYTCELDLFLDGKKYCSPDIIFYKNDLCVNHFSKNFYYRTQKAINKQRYKNFSIAITQLKKLIKNHYSCNVTTSNLRIYLNSNKSFNKKNIFNIEL